MIALPFGECAGVCSARFDDRGYGTQTINQMTALHVAFNRVWRWLRKALETYGPTHRKRHVWQRIESGECQLWTTENSAIVTSIETWPTGLTELNFWLAGGDLSELLRIRPEVEEWAIGKGCHRASIVGRSGWLRALPGYRAATTASIKDLRA
jgi:hypothetical protein